MNKQKLTYLSPETETLVVRFEGAIMEYSINENSGIQNGNIIPSTPGSGFGGWENGD